MTQPLFDASALMMTIACDKWAEIPFDPEPLTQRVVQSVLQHVAPSFLLKEMSVVLADDGFLQDLNKRYRQNDKPTNILSFGYGEDLFNQGVLGDLFLSFETVMREVHENQKPFQDHYIHLIIHGTLHLLGYDHEEEEKARLMEGLEITLLKQFNIGNPYET